MYSQMLPGMAAERTSTLRREAAKAAQVRLARSAQPARRASVVSYASARFVRRTAHP